MNQWKLALLDVENNDDREKFVELVKIGNGDHIYAKECSNAEAITQIKMEIENHKLITCKHCGDVQWRCVSRKQGIYPKNPPP